MLGSKFLRFLTLISVIGLTACGGSSDTDASSNSVVLSIPDPVNPVAIDTKIGGAFEGDALQAPADLEPENSTQITYRDSDTNRLTSSDISQAPDFTLDAFALSFERVSAANPNLSTSSDEFAKLVIADLVQSKKTVSAGLSQRIAL